MNNLTPTDYFNYVKDKQQKTTHEELKSLYDESATLLAKFMKTGQRDGAKRLVALIDNIEREFDIVSRGYDTYVDKADIEYYISNVSEKVVKIIEVSRYEREIPDEIVDNMLEVKDLFDDFLIVFTDYTGEAESKVAEERKDKDPIMFGIFYDDMYGTAHDKFYYIGDWEDEYCDLTLTKMVKEMAKDNSRKVKKSILTDGDIAKVKAMLDSDNTPKNVQVAKKPNLINRVRKWLGGK